MSKADRRRRLMDLRLLIEQLQEQFPCPQYVPARPRSANTPGKAATAIRAPTASAEASQRPAGIQHSIQQSAPSAEHGASARPAAESGLSHKQEAPAGSRRFTPAQQAVATALMVVIKRALSNSKQSVCSAKCILEMNNPATSDFLRMLPDNGLLPAMKQVEERASAQHLESLTKLAKQCAAAQCQPLEVFTRSMQCDARVKELEHGGVQRGAYEWQQRKEQQRMPLLSSFLQGLAEGLQRKHWPQDMADLYVTFAQLMRLYEHEAEATSYGPADLDHILPGALDVMAQHGDKNPLDDDLMRDLTSAFRSILQAYKARATSCGQSYKHMVLLEAAVQGWSLDTPYVSGLLRAMIAAEPPLDTTATTPDHDARQASSCAAAKVAPAQEQAPQSLAMSCLAEYPPDVRAIFKRLMSFMDLSDKDMSPIPAQALNAQEKRLKVLLTRLFPGIMEELYCVFDNKNADMCSDLVKAAARHVHSHVQVWRSEAREQRLSLPQMVHHEVRLRGFKPSELPEDIESAIYSISTRLRAAPADKDVFHRQVYSIMMMMYGWGKTGAGLTGDYWLYKVQAQQFDLRIYADEHRVRMADHVLLTGPYQAALDPLAAASISDPVGSLSAHTAIIKSIIRKHERDAQTLGKSLRAHLEDLAGYNNNNGWGAGKSDIAHLITLMADRAFQEEGPFGEGWRKYGLEDPDMAGLLESACKLALRGNGGFQYSRLCSILQGLPLKVSAEYMSTTLSQLQQDGTKIKNRLLVHKRLAVKHNMPFRRYMEIYFEELRIDFRQPDGKAVLEVICKVALAQSNEENAAASPPTAQGHGATAASSNGAAAGSSDATGQSSRAMAEEAAADSGSIAQMPGQQGGDRAADVAGGASSKKLANAGQGQPEAEQDAQETMQPQGGVSATEKAEKRRAKKARQRAARAQAAAQAAEAEGTSSKEKEEQEQEVTEGMGSTSKEEQSAEAEAEEQPPDAIHLSGSRFAALESLPADGAPAESSEEAPSRSGSSLSPQPSLPLHDGRPHGQQEGDLPKPAAQAAQAAAPAAQDEGSWQVKTSRRRAASQQAASKASQSKAPGHGESAPDQQDSALLTPRLRDRQAAAQHAEQACPNSEKAAVPPRAKPVPEAAEHLPQQLSGLGGSRPQQPSQQRSPDSVLHSSSSPGTSLQDQMAKAKLSEEGHQEDDEELCVVCWEKAPVVIFYQCMHMCTCQGCAKDIMAAGALCPMCRASIQKTITAKF